MALMNFKNKVSKINPTYIIKPNISIEIKKINAEKIDRFFLNRYKIIIIFFSSFR